VGLFVAETCTAAMGVPTWPETLALLTTGTLPVLAGVMLSVIVAAAEVPAEFAAVTLTVAPVAVCVGVPVIRPVELIDSP
jgi:hypothetical protein